MIEVHEIASDPEAGAALAVTLTHDQRQRTRLRVHADSGEALAVILPRGTVLRDGDVLRSTGGQRIAVRAAAEEVSTVHSPDPVALARACYHLGNRHVALQIGAGWARYRHDHVLDDMVRGLGLEVSAERAPFEPEHGAYGHGGHHHHGAHHGDDEHGG
jgi:urease accessory protein